MEKHVITRSEIEAILKEKDSPNIIWIEKNEMNIDLAAQAFYNYLKKC